MYKVVRNYIKLYNTIKQTSAIIKLSSYTLKHSAIALGAFCVLSLISFDCSKRMILQRQSYKLEQTFE